MAHNNTQHAHHPLNGNPDKAQQQDKSAFDSAIRALESQVMSIGAHLAIDSKARAAYSSEIAKMSSELTRQVNSGHLTWKIAAEQAQETRNVIMAITRKRSTPVGRAAAEAMKQRGKTLNTLIAEKSIALYGNQANFYQLSDAQKNRIYAAIVKSSGKPRFDVTRNMRAAGIAGRGLIVISLAISIYSIAIADDKFHAAGREATVMGAGFGGTISGGALAGLACGPAAPACVAIGAFDGGTLAAFGLTFFW